MRFDQDAARNADLMVWRAQFADALAISDLRPRQRQTCVGVVEKIRLDPRRQLEVTVDDGTGTITAIFTGKSNLPGLELGAALRLTGTVLANGNGETEMRNPAWGAVAEPYG
jgi:hypothetical protein